MSGDPHLHQELLSAAPSGSVPHKCGGGSSWRRRALPHRPWVAERRRV